MILPKEGINSQCGELANWGFGQACLTDGDYNIVFYLLYMIRLKLDWNKVHTVLILDHNSFTHN